MADPTSGEGVRVLFRRNDFIVPPTPDFLPWLYRARAYVPRARGCNILGISGLLNEYPSDDDLV